MVNLSERVNELETRIDGMQSGLDAVRGDVQSMLEQFAWLRTRWEEAERERKHKGKEGDQPLESTLDSEATPRVGGGLEREGGSGGIGPRGRKLEMPLFEGENPDEWIFRAERYFAVNQLADEEKIESAVLYFEAAALAWF